MISPSGSSGSASPKPSDNPYNAVGLALSMGCMMGVAAIASLALGLLIDRLLGTGRAFVLFCVLGGIPLNLIFALWLTRLLIPRVIKSAVPLPADAPESRNTDNDEASA